MRPSRRIFCFAPTTHTQCLHFVRNARNRQGVCNVLMVCNCCVLVVCACVCDCDCVCDCGPQRAFATICDGCTDKVLARRMWTYVVMCGFVRADYGASGRIRFFCETPTTLTSCTSRTTRTKTHCFGASAWRLSAFCSDGGLGEYGGLVSMVSEVSFVESVANL